MRLLLDTHIWIWLLESPQRVPSSVLSHIEEATYFVLSAASVWELGIKERLGKLTIQGGVSQLRIEILNATQAHELPIEAEHALVAASLPPLHRDPFDRMLVVQARIEKLTLVTVDEAIRNYGGDVLWASP